MCLFLTVPWVSLQCVIVAFPGHTHLLLFIYLVKFRCKMKRTYEYRRACFLMFGSDSISGMPDFAILKDERHRDNGTV